MYKFVISIIRQIELLTLVLAILTANLPAFATDSNDSVLDSINRDQTYQMGSNWNIRSIYNEYTMKQNIAEVTMRQELDSPKMDGYAASSDKTEKYEKLDLKHKVSYDKGNPVPQSAITEITEGKSMPDENVKEIQKEEFVRLNDNGSMIYTTIEKYIGLDDKLMKTKTTIVSLFWDPATRGYCQRYIREVSIKDDKGRLIENSELNLSFIDLNGRLAVYYSRDGYDYHAQSDVVSLYVYERKYGYMNDFGTGLGRSDVKPGRMTKEEAKEFFDKFGKLDALEIASNVKTIDYYRAFTQQFNEAGELIKVDDIYCDPVDYYGLDYGNWNKYRWRYESVIYDPRTSKCVGIFKTQVKDREGQILTQSVREYRSEYSATDFDKFAPTPFWYDTTPIGDRFESQDPKDSKKYFLDISRTPEVFFRPYSFKYFRDMIGLYDSLNFKEPRLGGLEKSKNICLTSSVNNHYENVYSLDIFEQNVYARENLIDTSYPGYVKYFMPPEGSITQAFNTEDFLSFVSLLREKKDKTEIESGILELAEIVVENVSYIDAKTLEEFEASIKIALESVSKYSNAILGADIKQFSLRLTRFIDEKKYLCEKYLVETSDLYEKLTNLLGIDIENDELPEVYSQIKMSPLEKRKILVDRAIILRRYELVRKTLSLNKQVELDKAVTKLGESRKDFTDSVTIIMQDFIKATRNILRSSTPVSLEEDATTMKVVLVSDGEYVEDPAR